MTPEAYVIGSIVFSVIVVASLYGLHGSDPIDPIVRCPKFYEKTKGMAKAIESAARSVGH